MIVFFFPKSVSNNVRHSLFIIQSSAPIIQRNNYTNPPKIQFPVPEDIVTSYDITNDNDADNDME